MWTNCPSSVLTKPFLPQLASQSPALSQREENNDQVTGKSGCFPHPHSARDWKQDPCMLSKCSAATIAYLTRSRPRKDPVPKTNKNPRQHLRKDTRSWIVAYSCVHTYMHTEKCSFIFPARGVLCIHFLNNQGASGCHQLHGFCG